MQHAAGHEPQFDLARSYMIADLWRDIRIIKTSGCASVSIDGQYSDAVSIKPDHTATPPGEAADFLLNGGKAR